MTTDVDIANAALSYLGEGSITSFADRSNRAAKANTHYTAARDEVLRAFNWPCAKTWVALTAYAEGALGTLPNNWTYAYQLPSDCLKARHIVHGRGQRPPKFEIFSHPDTDDSSQVLLCNIEDAVLVYTTTDIDEANFTSDLADAVAWKLAVKLALQITRSAQRLRDAEIGYQRAMAAAATAAANEEPDDPQEMDPEWIRERGYAGPDYGEVDRSA